MIDRRRVGQKGVGWDGMTKIVVLPAQLVVYIAVRLSIARKKG